MGRPCTICQHPARKAIEAAVHAGASLAEAAALHLGLTKAALGRHMVNHVAPVAPMTCEAVPDPLGFLSPPPPPVRVRKKPLPPVKPGATDPLAGIGNVVQFRATPPVPAEPQVEKTEEATPRTLAMLLHHGYDPGEVAQRFGLVEERMSALLVELEDAYTRQATGSASTVIIGRMIFKAEYAIAQLEQDYQAAKQAGRNRDARENRRLILMERQALHKMLREYGITRPIHPDELHSDDKGRRDADEIWQMIESSVKGVYIEPEPVPVRKPRLLG